MRDFFLRWQRSFGHCQIRLDPMVKKLLKNSWVQVGVLFLIGVGVMVSPLGPKNRSAQDMAIAFALPMILFDTVVPYGITWLLSFWRPAKSPQQQTLPLQHVRAPRSYHRHRGLGTVLFSVLLLVGTLALWFAAFLYPSLGVSWPVTPARRLALWCFALGVSPAILIAVYAAGVLTARHSRNLTQLVQDQFSVLTSRAVGVFKSGLP